VLNFSYNPTETLVSFQHPQIFYAIPSRKVSFGSVTDAGARTRSTLTTVVTTLRKRGLDSAQQIKETLDVLARDPTHDVYRLFFPPPSAQEFSDLPTRKIATTHAQRLTGTT
jgi:hypothetical protein